MTVAEGAGDGEGLGDGEGVGDAEGGADAEGAGDAEPARLWVEAPPLQASNEKVVRKMIENTLAAQKKRRKSASQTKSGKVERPL